LLNESIFPAQNVSQRTFQDYWCEILQAGRRSCQPTNIVTALKGQMLTNVNNSEMRRARQLIVT